MATILSSNDAHHDPQCPRRQKALAEIAWKRIEVVQAECRYICQHCTKVLGIGIRQGSA